MLPVGWWRYGKVAATVKGQLLGVLCPPALLVVVSATKDLEIGHETKITTTSFLLQYAANDQQTRALTRRAAAVGYLGTYGGPRLPQRDGIYR